MQIQPYLFFDGRCEEAIAFYQQALGAEVKMLMRYKDSPDQAMVKPETKDKVMHASLQIGETEVLASDGHAAGHPDFKGFGMALSAKTDADSERLFKALSDGGTVAMPMEKTFFSSRFGMVNDRFGILWMVMTHAG
jgi:PhnB protein